jgi:hypothetical protein
MRGGRRPPLLATLYAVGVYALGLLTLGGLARWGWPLIDAGGIATTVATLALWGTLWAGRATASRWQRRHSKEDRADQ